MMKIIRIFTIFAAASVFLLQPTFVQADDIVEALKEPGTHLILRHTLAPGTGDPDNFQIGDCSTQRNLNDEGRKQAKQLGDFLKRHNIRFDGVLSSQWCRCLETAELIDMGEVKEFEPLSSTWTRSQEVKVERTNDLKTFLNEDANQTNLLLVTHYINILELTGKTTASGEGLIIRVNHDTVTVIGHFSVTD